MTDNFFCHNPFFSKFIYKAIAIFTTQTQIVTRCILNQIEGMNLKNMNIGNANAVKLNKIGELTLYVLW